MKAEILEKKGKKYIELKAESKEEKELLTLLSNADLLVLKGKGNKYLLAAIETKG